MSIPLDRLYYYVESIAEEVHGDSIIIYHFYPHGSKNIKNIISLNTSDIGPKWQYSPHIICNDQEPLDFNFYSQYEGNIRPRVLNGDSPKTDNIFKKMLLLHSEQNSKEVIKYKSDEFVPIYYWSHALIALDWFRFSQHVNLNKNIKKRFLIYNRAWSGTREYRLGFADRVIKLSIVNNCLMRINPIDSTLNKHYNLHNFLNPIWKPTHVIENYFPINTAESHYSADFDIEDYNNTDIEVVLETLFDDQRIHLTEKILRPIALGQPFILAGTAGSLEYLRSYGFKTFDECWNESYDLETDPQYRLVAITDLMKHIADGGPKIYTNKIIQALAIANYNRQHFFSKEFFNQVVDELKINLKSGLMVLDNTRSL